MTKQKKEKWIMPNLQYILNADDNKIFQKALAKILKRFALWSHYRHVVKKGGIKEFENFIAIFKNTAEDGGVEDKEEIKSCKRITDLSTKFYEEKKYGKIAEVFTTICHDHLIQAFHITPAQLRTPEKYDKAISELIDIVSFKISFPLILLEFMCEGRKFKWNREKDIVESGIMLIEACFNAFQEKIHDYFEDGDEDIIDYED